jgi:hypothetical protein
VEEGDKGVVGGLDQQELGTLVVVSKAVSLFHETGRKTVRIGPVVDQLSVNTVEDVPGIFQSRGAAEHVVTNSTKDGLHQLVTSGCAWVWGAFRIEGSEGWTSMHCRQLLRECASGRVGDTQMTTRSVLG